MGDAVARVREVLRGDAAVAYRTGAERGSARLAALDAALAEAERQLDRRRRVMARYATLVRRRQTRAAEVLDVRFLESMAKRQEDDRNLLAATRSIAVAGAHYDAMTRMRADLCDVVEAALHRIVGDIVPAERVAAVLDTALVEIVGRRRATLCVHPDTAGAVEAVLHTRIGTGWQDMISLERTPALAADMLEVRNADGLATVTAASQIALLATALRDALDHPPEAEEATEEIADASTDGIDCEEDDKDEDEDDGFETYAEDVYDYDEGEDGNYDAEDEGTDLPGTLT